MYDEVVNHSSEFAKFATAHSYIEIWITHSFLNHKSIMTLQRHQPRKWWSTILTRKFRSKNILLLCISIVLTDIQFKFKHLHLQLQVQQSFAATINKAEACVHYIWEIFLKLAVLGCLLTGQTIFWFIYLHMRWNNIPHYFTKYEIETKCCTQFFFNEQDDSIVQYLSFKFIYFLLI